MTLIGRPAPVADAGSVAVLANEFVTYTRTLGDTAEAKFSAET